MDDIKTTTEFIKNENGTFKLEIKEPEKIYDSNMHHFNIEIAKDYGIIEAILIQNIKFWIETNIANKINIHENNCWTFNSIVAFQKLFPYLTIKQIRYALTKLVKKEILIKGNFNKKKYDRTFWYAFKEPKKFISKKLYESLLQICKLHLPLVANGIALDGKPIPDINLNINSDKIKYLSNSPHLNSPEDSKDIISDPVDNSFKEKKDDSMFIGSPTDTLLKEKNSKHFITEETTEVDHCRKKEEYTGLANKKLYIELNLLEEKYFKEELDHNNFYNNFDITLTIDNFLINCYLIDRSLCNIMNYWKKINNLESRNLKEFLEEIYKNVDSKSRFNNFICCQLKKSWFRNLGIREEDENNEVFEKVFKLIKKDFEKTKEYEKGEYIVYNSEFEECMKKEEYSKEQRIFSFYKYIFFILFSNSEDKIKMFEKLYRIFHNKNKVLTFYWKNFKEFLFYNY